MTIKNFILSITLFYLLCFSTLSYSSSIKQKKSLNATCEFQETTDINIRFELIVAEAVLADEKIKAISSEIESIAIEKNVELFILKNLNFNLNSLRENQGSFYRLNGNMRYQLNSYQQGLELLDTLKASGYSASLSVNKYRNNC